MGYKTFTDKKVPMSSNAKALAGFKSDQQDLFTDDGGIPGRAKSSFNITPKVSQIKKGGRGELVVDYLTIQQLLTHKDPEVTAKAIGRDTSHIHLVAKQALRTIATRCGYTVATDFYTNYLDHASWWLAIVNSFIDENHLYNGGDKIRLIDSLIASLPPERQRSYLREKVDKLLNKKIA